MKNRMLICMAVAGGLLTSCGAYRKYRPVSSVPDNLYGVEITQTDTASIASMDWKTLFNDPCLQSEAASTTSSPE